MSYNLEKFGVAIKVKIPKLQALWNHPVAAQGQQNEFLVWSARDTEFYCFA